jgi:hypothetical protein
MMKLRFQVAPGPTATRPKKLQIYIPNELTPITLTLRIFELKIRNSNFGLTPRYNALVARILTLNVS